MAAARITGTGTFLGNVGSGVNGLLAGRAGTIHSITIMGTGGAGTVTFHDTDSATGTGTILVMSHRGTVGALNLDADVSLQGPISFQTGLRVEQSGTTGGLETYLSFD